MTYTAGVRHALVGTMQGKYFDRSKLHIASLSERDNRVEMERDHVRIDQSPRELPDATLRSIRLVAERIRKAKADNRPVMMSFGAHLIKNGLAPVLIELLRRGLVDHLATNGAGIIHDWEIAFQGSTSEDVRKNVAQGKFGIWRETGFYINCALNVGAYDGLGYGESIGAFIDHERVEVPSIEELRSTFSEARNEAVEAVSRKRFDKAAAAADLLSFMRQFGVEPGRMSVPHPYKRYSVQAAAFDAEVPFTGHPMFGHDIIYVHPANRGAAIGRTAERDFLRFANTISRLAGGVYISIGSAVMSPMVFEKSLSMARNAAHQAGERVEDFLIAAVDIAESSWDWAKGEPPADNPEYYNRICKSFSRMGGDFVYIQADNRNFLLQLLALLGDGRTRM